MKRLLISITAAVLLFADTPNEVTISDLKEAVYKLIIRYQQLSKETALQNNSLNFQILKLKSLLNKNNRISNEERKKIVNLIKKLGFKIKTLEKRVIKLEREKATLIILKNKKDYLDEYIDNYIKENKEILKKVKDENR